jgi:hypothetical protein
MILYHGSKELLKSLKPHQAVSKDPNQVPKDELLNAIYLTNDFKFALAMGARPEGITQIDNNKIRFEHPELFDPECSVYIYEFDTSDIPAENLRPIDSKQFTVNGVKSLTPKNFRKLKAEELLKYYELTNWKKPETEVKRLPRR